MSKTTLKLDNTRIKNAIKILNQALKHDISTAKASEKCGFASTYFKNVKADYNNLEDKYDEKFVLEFKTLLAQYEGEECIDPDIFIEEQIKHYEKVGSTGFKTNKKSVDTIAEDDYDDRSRSWENRNDEGKIISYGYKILIRDEKDLTGELSLKEMEKIYTLYPYVTANNTSEHFPYLTFANFKRILRCFNITKQNLFPKHILENHTEEEVAQFALKAKEHSSYKKFVQEKPVFLEKKLRETQKELSVLKEEREWAVNIVDQYIKFLETKKSFPIKAKPKVGLKSLVVSFGDIHFGKRFEKNTFGRGTNKDILRERLLQIAENVIAEVETNKFNKINLICLGDLVESILPDSGMHPGHIHEMDSFGSDQIIYAINTLEEMIDHIADNTDLQIELHGIGGNHDRVGLKRDEDKKRTSSKLIYAMLSKLYNTKGSRITINNPEDEIISIVIDNLNFIAFHGDSGLMKRKPLDLINLFRKGSADNYSVVLNGHWHSTKVEEGINFIQLGIGSVCSTDAFIQNELGLGSQPSFNIGCKSNGFGFDFKKITLY